MQATTKAQLITHSTDSPSTSGIIFPELLINYQESSSKHRAECSVTTTKLHHHALNHADTACTERKGLKVHISTLCTGGEGNRAGSTMGRQRPCKGRVGMKREAWIDQGQSKMGENGQVHLSKTRERRSWNKRERSALSEEEHEENQRVRRKWEIMSWKKEASTMLACTQEEAHPGKHMFSGCPHFSLPSSLSGAAR